MAQQALSKYLENRFLNQLLRNLSYTSYLKTYIALYSTNPTGDDIGVEVSTGNYSRVPLSASSSPWAISTSGSASNVSDIVFTTASSSWGDIKYIAIRTGSQAGTDKSSGSLLFFGPLSPSATVNASESLRVSSGNLQLALSDGYSNWAAEFLLEYLLTTTSFTPFQAYLSLYRTMPSRANVGGIEVNAVDYNRILVYGADYWDVPTAGSTTNTSDLIFTTSANENWGIIKGIGISSESASSVVGNHLLFLANLDTEISMQYGDGIKFSASSIIIYSDASTVSPI